jgi:hypothetical protein
MWLVRRHRRGAAIAFALALALLSAGCFGVWWQARPPLNLLIVPGAEDIQLDAVSLGEQRITYQWPGAPYGWYFAIVRNLSAERWEMPVDNRAGIRNTPEVHWRISQLWFVYLKEEIWLQGDPNVARIRVRRELIIPWRRYIP